MKYCQVCKVSVNTPIKRCPLCYTPLIRKNDKPEIQTYPDLTNQIVAYNLLIRILLFLSITTIVASFAVNYLVTPTYSWSWIVAVSIGYAWISISTLIKKKRKIGLNLFMQVISLCSLLVVLGYLIHIEHIIFNIVLPAVIGTAILTFNIFAIIKRHQIQHYLIYFLLVSILGFVPLILWFTNVVTLLWPAVICAVYGALSILSIFLFASRIAIHELRKRFKI